jgi:hypothetical protein
VVLETSSWTSAESVNFRLNSRCIERMCVVSLHYQTGTTIFVPQLVKGLCKAVVTGVVDTNVSHPFTNFFNENSLVTAASLACWCLEWSNGRLASTPNSNNFQFFESSLKVEGMNLCPTIRAIMSSVWGCRVLLSRKQEHAMGRQLVDSQISRPVRCLRETRLSDTVRVNQECLLLNSLLDFIVLFLP